MSSWNAGKGGPKTVDELREHMKKLVSKKAGKKLIDNKFTKDHVFAGHNGDTRKVAIQLAKLRKSERATIGKSSFLISSLDANAKKEVLNWVKNVPASVLKRSGTTWQISNKGGAVKMVSSYKFATVDLAEYELMNEDDKVKKSRKYMKVSDKTPKLACQFGSDGTPLIYHLDF